MKKLALIVVLFFGSGLAFTPHVHAEDSNALPKSEAKVPLKDPFSSMSSDEQAKAGIAKLTPEEQEFLAKWWYQHKASPHRQHIHKEITITAIQDGGKLVTFSDGSTLSFSSSKCKKTSLWAVGDTVGIGGHGKKGAVILYHMASGTKVKGKREQSPKHADKKNTTSTNKDAPST
jgi:hypothetical protein